MDNYYTRQIINKIESVMNKKNWNANIVAKKAGINSQTFRDILKSDDIKLSKLIIISRALDVDVVEWFMDDPDYEYNPKVIVGAAGAADPEVEYKKISRLERLEQQLIDKERYIKLLEKNLKYLENKQSDE